MVEEHGARHQHPRQVLRQEADREDGERGLVSASLQIDTHVLHIFG